MKTAKILLLNLLIITKSARSSIQHNLHESGNLHFEDQHTGFGPDKTCILLYEKPYLICMSYDLIKEENKDEETKYDKPYKFFISIDSFFISKIKFDNDYLIDLEYWKISGFDNKKDLIEKTRNNRGNLKYKFINFGNLTNSNNREKRFEFNYEDLYGLDFYTAKIFLNITCSGISKARKNDRHFKMEISFKLTKHYQRKKNALESFKNLFFEFLSPKNSYDQKSKTWTDVFEITSKELMKDFFEEFNKREYVTDATDAGQLFLNADEEEKKEFCSLFR